MRTNLDSALLFFKACETGKGWEICGEFCHPAASFSSQTAVLSHIDTLEDYCDWAKNLITAIPDGHFELKFFAEDPVQNAIAAYSVFRGTQTGPGGPVPATGKQLTADYVYHMVFEENRIKHMTKIWNDTISMQQLGWG